MLLFFHKSAEHYEVPPNIGMWELFESEMAKLNAKLRDVGDEHMSINNKRAHQNVSMVMFVGNDKKVLELVESRVKAEFLFIDGINFLYEASSIEELIAKVDKVQPALLWIDLPKSRLKEILLHLNDLGKHGKVHMVQGLFERYTGM